MKRRHDAAEVLPWWAARSQGWGDPDWRAAFRYRVWIELRALYQETHDTDPRSVKARAQRPSEPPRALLAEAIRRAEAHRPYE